ncbi:hypothetical protein AYO47_00565 [Planctomyces sp. SCGC AG-212-M04]|nr:hypothetical protein AYO47_00565 [Planctomyces sp. SCGC AG-212-M04]
MGAGSLPEPPGSRSPGQIDEGRELFTLNFARPDEAKLNHRLAKQGNGLGPVFNGTSCVGCHRQGGIGGSGGLDSNVVMLGIVTRPVLNRPVSDVLTSARAVHPGFRQESAIQVLHHFALGQSEDVAVYDSLRNSIFERFGGEEVLRSISPVRQQFGDATLELAQRNTTPLWGLGLIERFRQEGGEAIRARFAKEQTEKTPWITGRAPAAKGGQGWYGWRSQMSSLDDFVRSACAIEMGLDVPGFDEPENPVAVKSTTDRPAKVGRRQSRRSYDLTEEQCVALTSFVRSLPRPRESDEQSVFSSRGKTLFSRIGCADCHAPDLGWVHGLYSDMLLHDMGDDFSDAQTATPVRTVSTRILNPGGNGYYTVPITEIVEVPTNPQQEWKTPPLWGVRDSYPYMHDGRAATLREAILMHGGEAARAAAMFKSAEADDQQAIIAFLESLRAPAPEQDAGPVALK